MTVKCSVSQSVLHGTLGFLGKVKGSVRKSEDNSVVWMCCYIINQTPRWRQWLHGKTH